MMSNYCCGETVQLRASRGFYFVHCRLQTLFSAGIRQPDAGNGGGVVDVISDDQRQTADSVPRRAVDTNHRLNVS
jgi:hypothetical protein